MLSPDAVVGLRPQVVVPDAARAVAVGAPPPHTPRAVDRAVALGQQHSQPPAVDQGPPPGDVLQPGSETGAPAETRQATEMAAAAKREWGMRLVDPILQRSVIDQSVESANRGNPELLAAARIARHETGFGPDGQEIDQTMRFTHKEKQADGTMGRPMTVQIVGYEGNSVVLLKRMDAGHDTDNPLRMDIAADGGHQYGTLISNAVDRGITFADPQHEQILTSILQRDEHDRFTGLNGENIDSATLVETVRNLGYFTADDIRTLMNLTMLRADDPRLDRLRAPADQYQTAFDQHTRETGVRMEIEELLAEKPILNEKELAGVFRKLDIDFSREELQNETSRLRSESKQLRKKGLKEHRVEIATKETEARVLARVDASFTAIFGSLPENMRFENRTGDRDPGNYSLSRGLSRLADAGLMSGSDRPELLRTIAQGAKTGSAVDVVNALAPEDSTGLTIELDNEAEMRDALVTLDKSIRVRDVGSKTGKVLMGLGALGMLLAWSGISQD